MRKNTIAIIPARGGSKGIPRKNLRLLNGKPLIFYTIEKALESKCFTDVIVSTDSHEIAFFAKHCGANVIIRPKQLAGDNIGLDEVISQSVRAYEKESNKKVDFVATIQPTSPLISLKTIRMAMKKCTSGPYDTIISVYNDAHLSWTLNKSNRIAPNYKKRVNRQILPKNYRETGGIVICRRKILGKGTRFGSRIGIIECPKAETIDIDDRFDWWITEKQLCKKNIVIRVEGHSDIGLGHIYRCITLADNMLDHNITFVISKRSKLGISILKSRFYPVVTFSGGSRNEFAAIQSCSPFIVINDLLDTNQTYIKALKKLKYRVVNFEDQGKGSFHADIVINAMYDSGFKKKHRHILTGKKYVCLRDEFYIAKPVKIKKQVENVLVLFGGTDSKNYTEKILKWCLKSNIDFQMTIILGSGYKRTSALTKLIKSVSNRKIRIVTNTKIITQYMESADIAITSCGRTIFELASLGIPMIALSQNSREDSHCFVRREHGIIYLGRGNSIKYQKFKNTFDSLLRSR